MIRGRKSYAERSRTKLLDLWRGTDGFGRPLGCVATTFTFDPALFEEQCLGRFLSIEANANETAKAYLVEREEKLSQCFACVLVDQGHAAPDRSLRWHLLPVALPRGGVQHAKLSILMWENCIRVMVGSANLTEAGYRKNQELVAVLDFSQEAGLAPDLLRQCVAFIDRVRRLAPGSEHPNAGPQAALNAFLRSVEERALSLASAAKPEVECVVLPLVPDADQERRSVLDLLRQRWQGPAPDTAWVLSPFFDVEQQAGETAARLGALLTTRGKRSITFLTPGRWLADGTLQLDAPAVLRETSHPSLTHAFGLVRDDVQVGEERVMRPLHAKGVWVQRDDHALYMLGSSNFTAAGLGLHPSHNIELNVVYVLRNLSTPFAHLCVESWPEEQALADTSEAQFLGSAQSSASQDPDLPALPRAFGLLLYRLDETGANLELEIQSDAPESFEVRSRDADRLLDWDRWRRQGRPAHVTIPWGMPRPPSAVEVRWIDEQGQQCSAYWIVNVADASTLPPPAELTNLTLAELLEVLTSARPMHQTVMRVLERRQQRGPNGEVEVDPHRRVDTSNFLLGRMRRVSRALEGLRERLQQPVCTIEALRWRLRGPLGALTLARRLAEDDPEGAAFMIAEVAETVHGVTWRPVGSLDHAVLRSEVAAVLGELRRLSAGASTSPALRQFVEDTFAELLS